MIRTSITGNTMIFKNEKGFYSTSVSKKVTKQDGATEWQNAYLSVNFAKRVDIPNRTMINIKNGFLSFDQYVNKDNAKVINWKVVVLDYEVVGETKAPEQPKQISMEDDLPF